jgi:SAM-dependent methyltransferase
VPLMSQMSGLKQNLKKNRMLGPIVRRVMKSLGRGNSKFEGSRTYWESRYRTGGTSGPGSYGKLAEFKATFLNSFVQEHKVSSVMEFGCGDGNQLALATYPHYIGLDVSKTAIQFCKVKFHDDLTKSFFLYDSECFVDVHHVFKADLALSLDVIFHLIEDSVFELYMRHLFAAAEKYVIIYSGNSDENRPNQSPHVRHRCFSDWVQKNIPDWQLAQVIPNEHPFSGDMWTGSDAEFFIYEKSVPVN